MVTERRAPGALESDVLAALWSQDAPMTPADVREQLGGTLAYTTVMTTLSRLFDKGIVLREPAGRAYAYTPALDEAEFAAARLRELLDAGSDRKAVLARFVGTLSAADERVLSGLLGRKRPRR